MFKICDNSGALLGECIRILRDSTNSAKIADTIIIAIKSIKLSSRIKIKTHDVRSAIIVRTINKIPRHNGILLSFQDNTAVIIDKKNAPIGSRVKGPVGYEVRRKKHTKIVLMSPSTL